MPSWKRTDMGSRGEKPIEKRRGLFISLEGGDASGKSTQLALLRAYWQEKQRDVLFLREPGGTPLGEKIRTLILDKANVGMAPYTEALLYAASRAELVRKVIGPALDQGKVVVCDRYVDSSLAYQAYGRELGDIVRVINEPAIASYTPDLTIFFDIDPRAAFARMGRGDRKTIDRMEEESLAFHDRVYRGYQALIEEAEQKGDRRFLVLDAKAGKEDLAACIRETLDHLLITCDGGTPYGSGKGV